ncbi:MAG: biotin/lipoyl-binding protein, partial [Azoarcus sp.]|nr:biotin/lipoyl-binding protein [Azoarcus sp.]
MSSPDVSSVPPSSHDRRRRWLLQGLLLLLIVLALVLSVWYFSIARWYEHTDNAYVQGNMVQITPLIEGTVISIEAEDGMRVERGQLLIRLDPADTEVALQQAQADLARTVRQVRGMYRSVRGAQADLVVQQAALERARADFERRRGLSTSGAISSEEMAHVRITLKAAEASVDSSREQYERNKALIDDTVIADHPDVLASAARLRQAFL